MIEGDGRALRYAELLSRARGIAQVIAAEVPPGGLCALDLEPGIEHAIAMHGSILAGASFQTIRPGLPAGVRDGLLAEAAHVVDPAAISGGSPADRPPERDPAPALCRLMTSGTSGEPRPVELTATNFAASAAASSSLIPFGPGDRWLCCLPLDHVGGLSILIRAAIAGAAAVVHPRFDLEAVAAALAEVDVVSLVPTQLRRLLSVGAPLDGPRAVLLGGGAAPGELLATAAERGVSLFVTYGLTEACSQVCTLPPSEQAARPGSVGRPLPGIELTLEANEVRIGGPTVAPGAVAADGLLHTGDLGRLDAEGYLWIEGRADDLIVSGGENVRPEEVEEALATHPAVLEAAVAGRPHPDWGEEVIAWVVAAAGAHPDPDALREHCRELLSPPKVPKRIEIVAALPRTASGKLLRRDL